MIFLVGDLMGWTPDRKWKSTENSCFYSKENFLSLFVINDHNSDSSYSLNEIILENFPEFLDL